MTAPPRVFSPSSIILLNFVLLRIQPRKKKLGVFQNVISYFFFKLRNLKLRKSGGVFLLTFARICTWWIDSKFTPLDVEDGLNLMLFTVGLKF